MKTALVALLMLAASCTAGPKAAPSARPTPDYGVQEWSAQPDGSNNCGDFAVGWESPDLGGGGAPATLHAINGEDMVLDLKGTDDREQLTALWCGNVAGDGRLELATQRYTGGAHCCFTVRVDTLDGPTLLDVDLGNYGGLEPKDVDKEGADELVGSSDVLAYFGDLPFAATQDLPLVFAFRGGRYVEATSDFPELVRERMTKMRNSLVLKVGSAADEQELRSLALGVFGHYVLLGDPSGGLDAVEAVGSKDTTVWLQEHADEAAALVRGEATPAP